MPAMHWIRSHIALAPLPGRFVSVHLLDRDDPGRGEVEAFIARVYRDRYGATLRTFFPHLLAYRDSDGRLAAAVGVLVWLLAPILTPFVVSALLAWLFVRRQPKPQPKAPVRRGFDSEALAASIADGTYQAINDKFFSVNLLTLEQ